MAVATMDESRASWRDIFQITRINVFSVVFIVVGLAMLVFTPSNVGGGVVSTLRFPHDGGLGFELAIPTVAYAVVVGLLYLGGGVFGLLPLADRFDRPKTIWLILNGALVIPTVLVLAANGKSTNMVSMLAASFRLATPIAIGAMAGIWCERSGVVNIAIEGMMLTAACFGLVAYTFVATTTPGPAGQWIGVGVAMISGGLMALLHAWLSVTFKTDQIISGTVINILALGITAFARNELLINADASVPTFDVIAIPLLSDLPIVGEVLFTGKPIFFMMFLLVIGTHVMLYYTRWGLRTRAVGENPHAADTLGIDVARNRYFNVVIGGLIAGIAGAWFSIESAGVFREGMTDGAGFIALAAMIFGKWTPSGAAAGALLFGFSQALDTRFQILQVEVPVQFVQMTPYIVTMIVLAGLVGRAIPPKAVGQPFEKE
jgi:general nucleoside transport system permease protein